MVTAISQGVKVSIETVFQEKYSDPANEHFLFAYSIRIENLTEYTVQLMARKWYIFDSNGAKREVEGEGVVGLQPIIEPGGFHHYVSGCDLKTEFGSMRGFYIMKRKADDFEFLVEIPVFELIAPYKLN